MPSRHFSWLHFTDFQFAKQPGPAYEFARRALFDDLRQLHDKLGPWHAVFVTGDLVFSGQPEEYGRVTDELNALHEHLRILGSEPVLYSVPGNHDVDRETLTKSDVDLMLYLGESPQRVAQLQDPASSYRGSVATAFGPYVDWAESWTLEAQAKKGGVAGDFSAVARGEGCEVGIVGLNSAFVQLDDGDYYGRLALDLSQLMSVCGGDWDDWFGQRDAALLLTHHSPGWLNLSSRVNLYSKIAPIGRFASHLCGGFEHSSLWYHQGPTVPGQLLLQCRPFTDRTEPGYVAGTISLNGSAPSVTVWPRVLKKSADQFRPDLSYARDLTEGDSFIVEHSSRRQEPRKLYVPAEHGATIPEPPVILEYLELRNFRCFERLLIPLDQPSGLPGHWTCIVGINGAGKSSILEALCLSLLGQPTIIELGGVRLDRMRRKVDEERFDAQLRLWLRDGDERHYLELRIDDLASKSRSPSVEMPEETLKYWHRLRSKLLGAYGATRNLADYRDTRHINLSADLRRLMTMFDPLSQLATTDVLLESQKGNDVVYELLASLVERVFGDEIQVVRRDGKLEFQLEEATVDALNLPDGYRSSIAWLADICATWVEKNPDAASQADPAAIEGIVLIDEVALHLHPALQREIVPRLRAALPRVQWVVSTHSPLVLSGFDSREIVALDREEPDGIRQLDRQIIGFSTDEIVNWLMETPTSSAAMERVLAQQEDENDAQEAIIGQMLRTSPDRSEGEAQSALEDFKRRLARFENDVS